MWNINNFPVYHKQECECDTFHPLHLTHVLFPHIVLLLSDLAEVVKILTYILNVPSLSLGQGTDYPDLDILWFSLRPSMQKLGLYVMLSHDHLQSSSIIRSFDAI
jgi:hypothetical protein